MPLDIKSLIACNAAIAIFMASALLFYMLNYKTYPGYALWLSSVFVLALSYASVLLRSMVPDLFNILIANTLPVLVGILRLDGIRRFTHNKALKKSVYLTPLALVPALLFFYLVKDSSVIRNLMFSTLATIVSVLGAIQFFTHRTRHNSNLFIATGIIVLLYGVFVMARAIAWCMNPQYSLFQAGLVPQLYFLISSALEVGLGFAWLALNSQRLEGELSISHENLKITVAQLEKAVSEVNSLSGIIPICMHCKEIRDDKGYWNNLEAFISEHSEAEFSHGICPKCLKEHYPDIALDQE